MDKRGNAPWQEQLRAWLAAEAFPRSRSDPRYWRKRRLAAERKESADGPSPQAHSSSANSEAPPLVSAAEERLWRQWLRDAAVRPLAHPPRVVLEPPLPPPRPRQREQDEAAIRTELLAPLTLEDWLEHDSDTQFLRPGVPRRVLAEMRRGRWTIRRQLDLHGLTREAARAAMSRFLSEALAAGERCVRIVHGKGLGSPGGVSVLKHLSRQWLSRREEILAYCEAAPQQGGSGALLVLLRAPHAVP